MTPEERAEMERLCRKIIEEKDPHKLELLMRELSEFLGDNHECDKSA